MSRRLNARGSADRLRKDTQPIRRTLLAAALATAALGGSAASASAAGPWGFEQISPADSTSTSVTGIAASRDMSMVVANTRLVPLPGMPADGRGAHYTYGLQRAGAPWTVGPVSAMNGVQATHAVRGMTPDGSRMLLQGALTSVDGSFGIYQVDAQGAAWNMTGPNPASVVWGSESLDAIAFRTFSAGVAPVLLGTPGNAPVPVSVDNAGALMSTETLGGGSDLSNLALTDNAMASDGSSVIFTSVDAIPGDDDGGTLDVYRRILTPGAEQTVPISDANGSGDPDAAADARYRWATKDHQRVFFVTDESLDAGDTDGEQDVYMRVGSAAPIRVSRGEVVDGSPTGNGSNPSAFRPDWAMSSEDGNRTFFTTSERLTEDAPADALVNLYEYDVAEGRTRFVAGPLSTEDVADNRAEHFHGSLLNAAAKDLSFRGIRITPNGAVFMSTAPLAGSPADTESSVFVWTRGGELVHVAEPDADAPASATKRSLILPRNVSGEQEIPVNEMNPLRGGRGVSDDGSRVFFATGTSLTAEDTDGGYDDVYMWTAAEGVSLVTPPGRAPYNAAYLDSSPDGSEVYVNTAETILPGDTDPNAVDVYLAILGGGSPPAKPGPDADPGVCTGDGCQGPIGGPAAPPSIGSVGFAGAGNLPAAPRRPSVAVSRLRAVIGSAARLRVRVPGAGRISVSGRSLRRSQKRASKIGIYSVRVALSSRAKKQLKRKKTLKVRVRVAYRTSDGRSAARTVSVTFKQPKAKPATTKNGGR